jgi:hypothetical protein
MIILKITNLDKLLPKYGDHWALLSETNPKVEYDDKSYIPKTEPNLWYHMSPDTVPDTYTNYLKEKLNIQYVPAQRAIMWWNHTVKTNSPTTLNLAHVFKVKNLPFGLLKNPDEPRKIILLTPRSYIPESRTHVRNTGYMWAQITAAQLGEDYPTIDHLISLFAVDIDVAIGIIRKFNRYLLMGGN